MKQPHILCDSKDIAERIILPGDPGRVLKAAEYLDDWKEVSYNREYRTITGNYKNMPITITSTGIGGVSAAIAVEELIQCGANSFIRIGSAGALHPDILVGDLIIPIAAVREDGASKMYVSENFPAVSDHNLLKVLINTAENLGYKYYSGIIRSHDSFYTDKQQKIINYWADKNVIASDMETATIFTIAKLRGVKAAAVLNTVVTSDGDVRQGISDLVNEKNNAKEGEKREIILALESFYRDYLTENMLIQ
ncbi:MAG TPA: nucleoside phosphorylase [Thermoanaerobacterales bacterium]|nr:nucleoside phosphorylase [Thermoanaerobacterales bacterium]